MEHPSDQKGSKIAHVSKSNPLEAANLHRVIISHHRFDTATHLGQTENFLTFYEELKVAYHVNNNLQSFEVARVDNFSGKI